MTSKRVLEIFREITTIPRESGHEEKIIAWLQKFAIDRGFESKTDSAGNVVIIKEAAEGKEKVPTIVLQSHSDMVCEKNSNVEFDFAKDPIKVEEENGWLIAKETTLGADCGIGMAAQLALMEDSSLQLGRIESLFTTQEETGLDGAKALKPGFITGDILLNLDSEDEGELFIGCAGGIDTTAKFHYTLSKNKKGYISYKFGYSGGLGGHSGDDIDKNRSNAVQLIARFLYKAFSTVKEIELNYIDGGNKRNAIARESFAVLSFPAGKKNEIFEIFDSLYQEIKTEFELSDPNIISYSEEIIRPSQEYNTEHIITKGVAFGLIAALNSAPHGVLAMSNDIKGLVETSSNLASVKIIPEDKIIRVGTSQRSSINSSRKYAAEKVESSFIIAGAEVTHESEYPGWKPRLDSPLLKICEDSYKKLFNKEPIVRAIHAGLECGLFLDIYPSLDMISFGPTIRGAHAPGERLEIATVDKFVLLLEDVVKTIAIW